MSPTPVAKLDNLKPLPPSTVQDELLFRLYRLGDRERVRTLFREAVDTGRESEFIPTPVIIFSSFPPTRRLK